MVKFRKGSTVRVDVPQDVCGESGWYAPAKADGTLILEEKRRFKFGEEFPDDRFWVPVSE